MTLKNDFQKQLGGKYDFEEYMEKLERIRKNGAINMFEAPRYLSQSEGIPIDDARKIVLFWMQNYGKLQKQFNW